MKLLLRLLREPLLHFLAIGGLIFLLFAAVDDTRDAPTDVIVVTAERINQLAAGYSSVWKRTPTDDEPEGTRFSNIHTARLERYDSRVSRFALTA